MTIEIKQHWSERVLHSSEKTTMKEALEEAVLAGISLVGARLDRASLDGARLDGARLDRASLVGASLVGARLDRASLDGARLDGARLDGARLDGARLDRASLDRASLDGARLDRANLEPIRADLDQVLLAAPAEIAGLKKAIIEGRINGSAYEGDCACLVGTIANTRGCKYTEIPNLAPDGSRPIERFFLAIGTGDTPETSQFSALAIKWIEQFETRIADAIKVFAPHA